MLNKLSFFPKYFEAKGWQHFDLKNTRNWGVFAKY
jgi:hypothetical protein